MKLSDTSPSGIYIVRFHKRRSPKDSQTLETTLAALPEKMRELSDANCLVEWMFPKFTREDIVRVCKASGSRLFVYAQEWIIRAAENSSITKATGGVGLQEFEDNYIMASCAYRMLYDCCKHASKSLQKLNAEYNVRCNVYWDDSELELVFNVQAPDDTVILEGKSDNFDALLSTVEKWLMSASDLSRVR